MSDIKVTLKEDGKTDILYAPSGTHIVAEPHKKAAGTYISPPDLLAASLAACALDVMGKMAAHQQESAAGISIDVEESMEEHPFRIKEIKLHVSFPASFDARKKKLYLASITPCPVYNSLNPGIKVDVTSN